MRMLLTLLLGAAHVSLCQATCGLVHELYAVRLSMGQLTHVVYGLRSRGADCHCVIAASAMVAILHPHALPQPPERCSS
jgi:hypothetical protein